MTEFEPNSLPGGSGAEPFAQFLGSRGLSLCRREALVLQVNVGLLCNQLCRHCHLEAGPSRSEVMDLDTAQQVIEFANRGAFKVIDITGGAPEMNPHLCRLISGLAPLAPELILRSNLTLIGSGELDYLVELCREHRVSIVGSFPSLNKAQSESQRGKDVFDKMIAALRLLNSRGYGMSGSGLKLDLVANPAGAFLPASQEQLERKYRQDLEKNWGIVFSSLYTFGNVPLGRFRRWLMQTSNYESYMAKLIAGFNPCTLDGLMCRSLLSVSWDGYLYDCDFNQAAGIPLGGEKTHVSRLTSPPGEGSRIAVGEHCFACTSGSGFT